ncbi:hypothetical protein [Rubrivirga litoralis]|uniref:Lipoprotein n=1 Tax=Rubrivirga litoralis TaxID=3075598 RepID=A0ABU3BS22_9BACT|nr:hypothetical protein [Rubrivirga sp. F394]MDT0632086.1 hypothetical protein [Rubrivirga sp. F394]
MFARFAAFVLLSAVGGCAADAPPAAAPSEADRLLANVTQDALAGAFARLDSAGYVADLDVTQRDAGGAAVGEAALTVRSAGGAVRVEERRGTGTLAEPSDDPPRLRDPIGSALPSEPAFVDPASREQYRRAVVGDTVVAGRALRLVEAVLIDTTAEQAVRRVRAAVDPQTARPVVVEVERRADSVVYTEASRVRVALAPGRGGAWLPREVETDTRTDVPLAEPVRLRTAWTVRAGR